MGPVEQAALSNLIWILSRHETLFLPVLFVVDVTSYAQGRQPLDHALAYFLVLRSNPNLPNRTRLHRDMQKLMELSGSKTVPYLGGLGLSEM